MHKLALNSYHLGKITTILILVHFSMLKPNLLYNIVEHMSSINKKYINN